MEGTDDRGVLVAEQWLADPEAAAGYAGGVPVVEPPLSSAGARALASGEASSAGVTLEVPGVVGLLSVRADPERVTLARAFDETLGIALPERLSSTAADGRRLRWMSPDEWLLSCAPEEASEIERRLRAALGHAPRVAVTNVTAGWCVLVLGGPDARAVLARSVPLDVDPRAFPAARVANTVFAKANATLANLDDERYELICRRSFADYVARWIASASRGYGLAVVASG